MCLGASGKSRDLLVPHIEPLNLSLTTNGIRQPIEAVANDAVDAPYPRCGERLDELVCNGPRHGAPLSATTVRKRICHVHSRWPLRCSICELIVLPGARIFYKGKHRVSLEGMSDS